MFLKSEFSNRLVQISLFSAIVYYITAYPVVFEKARKYFPVKFKKTHHLLLFHTFVFAVLMYVLTYFVFDPLVKVVEGMPGDKYSITEVGKGVYECNNDLISNERDEFDDGLGDTFKNDPNIVRCPAKDGETPGEITQKDKGDNDKDPNTDIIFCPTGFVSGSRGAHTQLCGMGK